MNVVVTLEHRFDGTPDGKIWTQTTYAHSFWQPYLEVFEQVRVVARVRLVSTTPSGWKQANGEGVVFVPIPYYIGPWQYLWQSSQVKQVAQNVVEPGDAVILRVSSQIASCMYPHLHRTRHPYAVEVVADPYDVFAPGSTKHPLRPFFRWLYPRRLRYQCNRAIAAAYVTQQALQQRYACPNYSIGVSDVELPQEAFVISPRLVYSTSRPLTLIMVGSLAQLYKAPDILLSAVANCIHTGLDLRLIFVGDGRYRVYLEQQAVKHGIHNRVRFLGQLSSGEEVRAQLDQADLFVLPSYQEGLPRAMVEAMARGLPVIGSTVGGIPELLPSEDMVPPGDVPALADKIREVVTDPERMVCMSVRNLEKAKEYTEELLRSKRLTFYRYVREKTEEWMNQ